MASIVDASVFSKWYFHDEQLAAQAMALLERYQAGEEALLCPQFARYELASAVTNAASLGRISQDDSSAALSNFAALGITVGFDGNERLSVAATFAWRYGVSFYDALYLAIAGEFNARLITADSEFHRRTEEAAVEVIHLSDMR